MLYCFEPSLVAAPQSSERHWRFVWESIEDLQAQLRPFQAKVMVFYQEVESVLEAVLAEFEVQAVYSHQETGIKITFDRDLRIADFLKEKGIVWKEYLQQGVERKRKNRHRWNNLWFGLMSAPLKQPDLKSAKWVSLSKNFWEKFPQNSFPEAWKTPHPLMQPGGESTGRKYLKSFLEERVKNYNKHIRAIRQLRGCRFSPQRWPKTSSRDTQPINK